MARTPPASDAANLSPSGAFGAHDPSRMTCAREAPLGAEACPFCTGSGKCGKCAGAGTRKARKKWWRPEEHPACSACYGSGVCQLCQGAGHRHGRG